MGLIWISRAEQEHRRLLDLEKELQLASMQQTLDDRIDDANYLRRELARATHTNDSLATAHAELSATVTDLRGELAGARAQADAMDAAMSEKRIDGMIGKRVVLHTAGDHSIEGVLTDVYADCVVLKHAFYIDAVNGGRQTIVGDQIVPRPFEFAQELAYAGAEDS